MKSRLSKTAERGGERLAPGEPVRPRDLVSVVVDVEPGRASLSRRVYEPVARGLPAKRQRLPAVVFRWQGKGWFTRAGHGVLRRAGTTGLASSDPALRSLRELSLVVKARSRLRRPPVAHRETSDPSPWWPAAQPGGDGGAGRRGTGLRMG